MNRSSLIVHEGTVDSVTDSTAYVRIVQSSACAGCRASRVCHTSDAADRIIEVPLTGNVMAGSHVVIAGSESQGMRAVLLAFGLPLLLVAVVMTLSVVLGLSDAVAVSASLLSVLVYYGVLALFRNSLKGRFSFEIIEVK